MLKKYLEVNSEGLAIGGIHTIEDTIAPSEMWQEITGDATIGWSWDGSTWTAPLVTPEEIRHVRDLELLNSDWIVGRHRDQKDGGISTTLTDTKYSEWLTYRQDLRDLLTGYTPVVETEMVWPTAPTE